MLKRLFSVLLVLGALALPGFQVHPAHAQQTTVQTKDCVVYVTRTGARYHRAECSYLRTSAILMTRSKAIKSGYTPCKRCGGSDCED